MPASAEREGVVEREIVLRSEVQRAETRQLLHAATEAEFVALAELNLAIGLKCNQPVRVVEPLGDPAAGHVAGRLPADGRPGTTRIPRRSARGGDRRAKGAASPGPTSPPRSSRTGPCSTSSSTARTATPTLAWGSSGSTGRSSRAVGGSPRPAWPTRRCARRWPRPSRSPTISPSRSTRPTANAVTAWLGIDDARPAVDQARENYRLVQLRAREGAATPTEITDAQASLTRAQQNYLNARYSYLIAMARLEYAMGVGADAEDAGPRASLAATRPRHAEQPMSATPSAQPPPSSDTHPAAPAAPGASRRPPKLGSVRGRLARPGRRRSRSSPSGWCL